MNQLPMELRPRSFDDVVGQKLVVKELKNRSKTMNFPDKMTLHGSTGSGKTTCALIIAQLINCKNPVTNEQGEKSPCCACDSCLNVMSGKLTRDIKLIPCGEKLGIDKLMDISNQFYTQPMYDKKKIFIFDEAQSLSHAATQSPLLTIMEKEYKNVHIILTTMAVEKLEHAIISRTTPFKLKTIGSDSIYEYLYKLLLRLDPDEKVPAEFITGGLQTIANGVNGSVRDAIEYFDKAIQGELWTSDLVNEALDLIDAETESMLILKLLKKDWSVFEDIAKKKVSLEKLFYLSWGSIQLAVQARAGSNVIDDGFRSVFVKKYAEFQTIVELERAFYTSKTDSSYFDVKCFTHNLIEYMGEFIKKESVPDQVVQPKPTRVASS